MFGMTVTNFVKTYYGYTDIKAYYQSVAASAQSAVKNDLIILALVEKMPEIVLSEADYEKALDELYHEQVEENGYEGSYKKFLKEYEETALKISVYSDIILEMLDESKVIYDDVTRNGFFSDRNGMRYYVNGEFVKGWQKLDLDGKGEKDYYFDVETGYAPDACAKVLPQGAAAGEEKYLEFGENGLYVGLYNGIYKDGTGTRYFKDGVMQTGLQELDLDAENASNEKYFFDTETGYMVKNGVAKIGDYYYKFGQNGVMISENDGKAHGIVYDETAKTTRYFSMGTLLTGWVQYDKTANTATTVDFSAVTADSNFYYCDAETGIMATTAAKVGDTYYAFDAETGIYKGRFTGTFGDKTIEDGAEVPAQ